MKAYIEIELDDDFDGCYNCPFGVEDELYDVHCVFCCENGECPLNFA